MKISLKAVSRQSLLEHYGDFYQGHPFVRLYDLPKEKNAAWQYKPYPWISSVTGMNYCYIGLDVDTKRDRIVVISVLDSLGKGGAQVGIENMNLMFGLDRTSGLQQIACHPN